MLAKEIREMGEGDINARIAELERERFNLRLASGTRTLEDPLRLRVIQRHRAAQHRAPREDHWNRGGGSAGAREGEKRDGKTRAQERHRDEPQADE